MEFQEDYFLLLEAKKRLEDSKNKTTISMDMVLKNLGISEDEINDLGDVNIEWYIIGWNIFRKSENC